MSTVGPNIPIVNAGLLYVNGLQLDFLTTTTILVNAGAARDSTNINDIIIPAALTINVRNNGPLGLDTGVLAANTFYAVYAIGSSINTNDMSVLISANLTTPTLPLNYDMYRRIGCIKSDGTAAPNTLILPFWQVQKQMWYDAPISVLAATAAAGFTAQSLAVAIPSVVNQTRVTLQVDLLPNAAADFVEIRPTGSTAAAGNVKMSGDVAAVHHFDQIDVVCALNTASPKALSIDWLTDAVSTVALTVAAYVDNF
jgi:hypothetical protein